MAVDHNAPTPSFLVGALYCEEGDENEEEEEEENRSEISSSKQNPPVMEYDSYWDDDEHLQSLLTKERETASLRSTRLPPCLLIARKQAVEIILRIRLFHGFSASAAILAVNFLDRFLFDCLRSENEDKPWLMQLVAVSCLSLAAKLEETHVPLLLDLQVEEDAKYIFEAKSIQRMELLILSALKWRMHPVTPFSFIDHIVRRLGLKSDVIQLEFLRRCETTILSVISDSRIVGYYPSVVATATMLNVVRQVEYYGVNGAEYENAMFQVLKISKKEVEECYGAVISDDVVSKRKIWESSSDSSSSVASFQENKIDLSHTTS